MNRTLISCALLFAVFGLSGCRKTAEDPTADGVNPKDLRFANPELRTFVVEMDEAIRRAHPDWGPAPYMKKKRLFRDLSSRVSYKAEWNCHGPIANEKGQFFYPNHTISFYLSTVEPAQDLKPIEIGSIAAVWYPESGWGVRCDFTTPGSEASESFSLRIFECRKGRPLEEYAGRNEIRLKLPCPGVGGRIHHGDLSFRYGSSLKGVKFDRRTIQEIWSGPESFQRIALASLDQLEKQVRSDFATGKLVSSRPVPSGPRDGEPKIKSDRDPNLPAVRKRHARNRALKQIEQKRELIQQHYREMHAAIIRTLPLDQSLEAVTRGNEHK